MSCRAGIILGLIGWLAICSGCAEQERPRIVDLDPYVGRYPERQRPLMARPRGEPSRRPIGPVMIIVDAGHGGRDPGAIGVGPQPEKTVNLGIAMRLAALLEERGATVVTTRDSDRFIPLDERAALADRSRADLFVSIHADAARRADVSGATAYIARNASAQSRHAAESIITALERAGVGCRGIHMADFRVLAGHSRPAVLIECGFLTNSNDAVRLSTPGYQAKIAAAVAEGIAEHFSSY
ncbi:MAG: N-acetylmuramoyl-L-alanine amidase [Phycisphaerae bacterium]|nr:N-acetylmuramoyl-L-alanine amidase [Phycisphaerae bacterium]